MKSKKNSTIDSQNRLECNLISLENFKVLGSNQEQFQAESFCYFAFLAMFLLALDVDFLGQQLEEAMVFPTH